MDYYPLYRNYYPVREIPVHRQPVPEKKVIQIAVTDGSEQRQSRSDSAVKIQKVLRGFLVRKSMRKIAEIRSEVNLIEKKISSTETVELIRRDSIERLKINEMLMRLLLQLDSVRGVDSGVRDCRKAVIKKAIRLQEIVDSISDQTVEDSGTITNSASNSNSNHVQLPNSEESVPDVDPKLELQKQSGSAADSISNSSELQNTVESVPDVDTKLELQDKWELSLHDESEAKENPEEDDGENQGNVESNVEEKGEENECADSMELSQDKSQIGSSANPEEDEKDSGSPEKCETGCEIEENEERCIGKEVDGKSIILVEKLIEDNERMMRLMADLFKRNEMQTQLLSSLSQRVEHLEKAFVCEKTRKKKKKKCALRNSEKDKFN